MPDTSALLHHRFGVNHTPSQDWYFCFNDWNPGDIARDIATAWRGKPVHLPSAVPPPPTLRSPNATWDWITDHIATR